jgi:hypothetical protein
MAFLFNSSQTIDTKGFAGIYALALLAFVNRGVSSKKTRTHLLPLT